MNPLISLWPSPARCAGDGCTAGIDIWPLFHARYRGVYCRICSSCLLLSYRSLYCCCCFLLLGSSPPPNHDDGDPLLAPPAPTATCRVCHEAIAHLSCLQYSASGVFVCPACSAATTGRTFSYAPSCLAPLDVRGARVFLLATRMSLALLQKDAAEMQAQGERLAAEAANERKQAYRELGLAHGIDPKLPSTKDDIPPPVNLGPECSQANMGIALDLNEPAPPPSPATLAIDQEGVCTETAMAYADPPPPSLATHPTGMEGVCRAPPPSPATLAIGQEGVCTEMPMASAEPSPLSLATLTIGEEGVCTETAMASVEPPVHSLALLTIGQEGVSTELTMASAEPPLLSLATTATRMDGVCRGMGKGKAVASAEPPPRRMLQRFWSDMDEEDDE